MFESDGGNREEWRRLNQIDSFFLEVLTCWEQLTCMMKKVGGVGRNVLSQILWGHMIDH